MKFKIRDMLDSIDEEDLYKMQQDLAKGGIFLKRLIDDKVKESENIKMGNCITCGEELSNKPNTYTLIFGSEDFKKKASFCEIDCLEYFIAGLKKMETRIRDNGGDRDAV